MQRFALANVLKQDLVLNQEQIHYAAPEILSGAEVGPSIDHWAIGILTYELIVGFPPFFTGLEDDKLMRETILNGKVHLPKSKQVRMSLRLTDFINQLLSKKVDDRLGSKNGARDLLDHLWLKGDMQLSNLDEVLEVKEPDELASSVQSPVLTCYTATSFKEFIQFV